MKVESTSVKERINRIKDDYKHSISEDNERFVTGLLYGLTIATNVLAAVEKGEGA